ncbi:uncharacterized protein LOC127287050 [Leptopilina boulardi]|uniref:uncharacterized protein LOC127287050 n=1 Tax=Leptopilina boulardi TaxID=63433 RepID=UPI0021F5F033|nr:uncharacterized protein LOC127287050 [Leptopilina boulardi]
MKSCFIKHCDSGSKTQIKRDGCVRSFFKPSMKMLATWSEAIRRFDKTMNVTHKLCELHFKESDIDRYFECKLPNGNVDKILRDRPKLKEGAIPCVYLENINKLYPEIAVETVEDDINGFEGILKHIKNCTLPSDNWSVQVTKNNILWIRVMEDESFSCRRVILGRDLEVKLTCSHVADDKF